MRKNLAKKKVKQEIDIKLKTSSDLKLYLEKVIRLKSEKTLSKQERYVKKRIKYSLENILNDIENQRYKFTTVSTKERQGMHCLYN